MYAEIIAIGDEVLIGQTLDTNSHFIAGRLNDLGIPVREKKVIADATETIHRALDAVHPDTQLVFMTGGLGPTKDDITKESLRAYFGGEIVFLPEVYAHIVDLFKGFGREPKESNRQQAFLPSSCRPLANRLGTAPGMHFEKEGRHYFSLPGVPYETQALVEHEILPWIEAELFKPTVYHRSLLVQGIPESILAEKLAETEASLPTEVSLAYLPSPGLVRLRLTGRAGDYRLSRNAVQEQVQRLKAVLGPRIFGENRDTLEEVVGHLLREKGHTVALAESCTGGNIAALLTRVPGSSAYFLGGTVSYSNQAKCELLGVAESTLQEHGAVSEATVREMAAGARRSYRSDWALATSGVAGPGGGSAEKPVGLVWIALQGPGVDFAHSYRFGRDRERNVRRSTLMALDLLRRGLIKKMP